MKTLFKILDYLFPATMNFIWGLHYYLWCHQEGIAVFGAEEIDQKEALDNLIKPL